jgi:hypothetical protein
MPVGTVEDATKAAFRDRALIVAVVFRLPMPGAQEA